MERKMGVRSERERNQREIISHYLGIEKERSQGDSSYIEKAITFLQETDDPEIQ